MEGEHWFQGTADAVYQNLHLVTLYDADRVAIFAADHIYKMDVDQMLEYHMNKEADITVAANVIPSSEASAFGCIDTDETGRIIGFIEKPENPPEIPGKSGFTYVSMGNYIFEREILEESLIEDALLPTSHDFGRISFPSPLPVPGSSRMTSPQMSFRGSSIPSGAMTNPTGRTWEQFVHTGTHI